MKSLSICLSPAIDAAVRLDAWPTDGCVIKNAADTFAPGGKAVNVARWLTGEATSFAAMPDDFDRSCVGSRLGYVHRSGRHGFCFYGWQWLLDFIRTAFSSDPCGRDCPNRVRKEDLFSF